MKFLMVDDDPDILKLVSVLLTAAGYEVDCCETAIDAIQALSNLTYDILITDATMPAHSGFDLIRSAKKKTELEYLSIAMLTGRSEKRDIEQALELGVQDYIVKPIDPELFMEKITKLVDRHKVKKLQKPSVIKYNSEMSVPIKLLKITDLGLSIESPYPLVKGTIVKIDIDALKEAGLNQNRFKAIFNSKPQSSGRVIVELLLLEISETEQKILEQVAKKWSPDKLAS